MLRRFFLLLPFTLAGLKAHVAAKRRFHIPPTFWYENQKGEKWIPDENHFQTGETPEGFCYQHSRTPRQLTHDILGDGLNITSHCGWNEELATALFKDNYKLTEAIIIAALMCERCMNVAAYEYGLNWGYPKNSISYKKCNTCCEFCTGDNLNG